VFGYLRTVKEKLVKTNLALRKMVSFTVYPPNPVAAQRVKRPKD